MSSIYDLRLAIRDALVGEGIWTAEEIILKRQTEIWNDIAMAISSSKHGAVLVIGVAEGVDGRSDLLQSREKHLTQELTIPITTICEIQLTEGATPEEDLWERTTLFLSGWVPPLDYTRGGHSDYRLRYQRFSDDVEMGDGQASWLARQTIFQTKHITIPTPPPSTP
jgi:hypothetical protein